MGNYNGMICVKCGSDKTIEYGKDPHFKNKLKGNKKNLCCNCGKEW